MTLPLFTGMHVTCGRGSVLLLQYNSYYLEFCGWGHVLGFWVAIWRLALAVSRWAPYCSKLLSIVSSYTLAANFAPWSNLLPTIALLLCCCSVVYAYSFILFFVLCRYILAKSRHSMLHPTPTAVAGGRFLPSFVCMCVCLFFCTISKSRCSQDR